MAFCTNCGAKLEEGSKFCGECGKQVIGVEGAQATQQTQYQQSYTQPQVNKTKSKTPVIIGIASVIVVIAIICVAVIAGNSNNRDNNKVTHNTEKPMEEPAEKPTEKTTESPTTEVATEKTTTEIATEAKKADEYVPDIINEIVSSPDYVSSIASLGVLGDVNDDGVKELLLTYKANVPSVGYCVIYSLMRIDSDGGEIILRNTLYEEVGGNSGYCGVTEYNGKKYFTLVQKIANGSGYSEYINLLPWDASGEKLTNDGSYYMECAVNIDAGRENGIFIWGDQKISMDEYDAIKNSMSWIHQLDPNMGPDPGYTASFDELLSIGSY